LLRYASLVRRSPSLVVRFALAVTTALVALVLAEGVCSLALSRSLWRGNSATSLDDWVNALRRDADRFASATRLPGIYQAHVDPFVRYTTRADASFEIRDVPVTTDQLGMRKRPGEPPAPDALRVVVVGDSVAFGYGVKDDETLASQLESFLRAGTKSGSRSIACFTAAAPGWNLLQSLAFLETHWDAIRPDVVVLLPINNDLYDADDVAESGHRFLSPDPAQRDPLLLAHANSASFLVLGLIAQRRKILGEDRSTAFTGPEIMTAALSEESRARYAASATRIRDLGNLLSRRSGHLFIARYVDDDFSRRLEAALAATGAPPPIVPLFARIERSSTLGDDPHPNPATLSAMGLVIAHRIGREILGDGFEPPPLRDIPPALATELLRVDAESTAATRLELANQRALDELRNAFDTTTAEGARQAYGGVNPDGTLGRRAKLVLARTGNRLRVHLQSLATRDDLVPNAFEVTVDGAVLGSLESNAASLDFESTFPLPANANARAIEIDITALRCGVISLAGASQVASARVVRIEVLPD
jgi:hypothetical protein